MAEQSRPLGTSSGVGIVIANMIGAGVFLSAGFMAQDLGPGLILIAWSIGALLAIAGARAYAELATIVPRSGGEYRFLSDVLHPALGYLAGWASLLIGFPRPSRSMRWRPARFCKASRRESMPNVACS